MTSPDTLSASFSKSAFTSTLLILVSLLLLQNASAQSPQMRPVARLLADPVNEATYSRPRTVGSVTSDTAGSRKAASPSFNDANEIERRAFEKTNEARVATGLAALAWDPELCLMARIHSEDMARQGYFAHETPEGLHLKERARAIGVARFRVIGENIAYNKGHNDPGAFAVERWMNSGGHRANILYLGFQASAIGTYISSDGSVYLTQVFITR